MQKALFTVLAGRALIASMGILSMFLTIVGGDSVTANLPSKSTNGRRDILGQVLQNTHVR